jgi:hypothetical protein
LRESQENRDSRDTRIVARVVARVDRENRKKRFTNRESLQAFFNGRDKQKIIESQNRNSFREGNKAIVEK